MEFLERSDEIAELACALSAAQGEIEDAVKDGDNPHLGNRYATLSSIWAAIRAPLSKQGLSILQPTVAPEPGAVSVKTVLLHASGQYVSSVLTLPVRDAKGLTDTQVYGSALSYARRYGLMALIGVCPDEDDGNAAGSMQEKRQAPRSQAQPVRTEQDDERAQPAARQAEKPSDAQLHEQAVNHARQEYFKAAEEVGIDKAVARTPTEIRKIVKIVLSKFHDLKTTEFGVTHWNQLTVALLAYTRDPANPSLPGQIGYRATG